MKKRHRNVAHMWADKQVIRFFRKNFEKKHYKNFRSVYLALCEIDSDFGEGKEIGGFTKTVATYAGMKVHTISPYLQAIRNVGLIDYTQKISHGRFGKTNLIMYKWEEVTEEQIISLTQFINKNKQIKETAVMPKTVMPKTVMPKTALPKTTLYKNTNKLVNNCKNSFSKEKESERKARALNPEKISHTIHKENFSENSKDLLSTKVLEDTPVDFFAPNIPSNNKISETNSNIPDQSQTPGKSKVNSISEENSNISQTIISNSSNNIGMKLVELFCKERKECFSDVPSPHAKMKQGWVVTMGNIIERGYKSDVIADVIKFIFNSEDPFWRERVASPGQLWENIDTVAQQMAAKAQKDKKKAEERKSREFLLK